MLRDKIKISSAFKKIKENFYFTSGTNIIYQNRVTRAGIATKTIILLLIASFFSGVSYFFTGFMINYKKNIYIFNIFSSIISFAWIIFFVFMIIGTRSIGASKACSFVCSIFTGIPLGIMLNLCEIVMPNIMPICLIALFATASVFGVTSYLYYKGSLLEIDNLQLIKKMSYIFFALTIIEFIALFFCSGTLYAMICIPINLFMIVFTTLILIEHFRYVDNIIMNSMPIEYEWQLSLVFLKLFIYIFYRIFDTLIILFGSTNRD
ncbi:Bax inhibitor-1/YccA family protein [Candidatus Phytoplasma rubi]|uniref:Bax inhibitor-1/YccA family protein n=1 Tax=Candidatus Phytoplasma rubi TaxID=399025 RepID=A0ABY7BR57_9MOLU|nr:Bax inhibitor-1/YccA family protein [Candidatus Phytoplasma rubi]WAN63203.1 Bax inhibitor-1/YccA family protein [Candidatus Phytoplasma rubi]